MEVGEYPINKLPKYYEGTKIVSAHKVREFESI